MPLSAGQRLGPFSILTRIGAGGMGEVWRARDTRLEREIAIKFLTAECAENADRLRRFEQEAKTLAALNHPNILLIHETGVHDGAPYLVSELLEGRTLREELSGPALPQRKAVEYALQIAQGLAAAHAKGVIHRDLKPENTFVTQDGRLKILDFGLAKLRENQKSAVDENAPTLIQSTEPGMVMGTPGYMSPEQVCGGDVDHRSDLFSFGAILYELLSGQRAFKGATKVETMTAILKEEPAELTELNPNVSPALDRIVRRCLEKDPSRRFQSASDLAFALDALAGTSTTRISQTALDAASVKETLLSWRPLGWIVAALTLIGSALTFTWLPKSTEKQRAPEPRTIRRYLMNLDSAPLARAHLDSPIALSPDGNLLAYAIDEGETNRLVIRGISELKAEPVPGTEHAAQPFFSFDSQWVGYWNLSRSKLMKVSVNGRERPVEICDARRLLGASWGDDDRIVFAEGPGGLARVSALGGPVKPLTVAGLTNDYSYHATPYVLPGSKAVLFTMRRLPRLTDSVLAVASLESGATTNWTILAKAAGRPSYSPTGHLIYAQEGKLMSMPFDPVGLTNRGEPTQVTSLRVDDPQSFLIAYTFSRDGLLAYVPGWSATRLLFKLALVNSDGTEVLLPAALLYGWIRLSPDEKRIAFEMRDTDGYSIYIYDIAADLRRKLPGMGESMSPVWSPDGERLAFVSRLADGETGFYQVPIDGRRPPERVGQSDLIGRGRFAAVDDMAWTPDGQSLVFRYRSATNGFNVGILPLNGKDAPLLDGKHNEEHPAISPDGNWLAYDSDKSGRAEIYIDRFHQLGNPRQVSTAGGSQPAWARDGKELYFVQDNALMALPVVRAEPLDFGKPRQLFSLKPYFITTASATGQFLRFDVASGGRFLFIKRESSTGEGRSPASTELVFVENWFEELKGKTAGKPGQR